LLLPYLVLLGVLAAFLIVLIATPWGRDPLRDEKLFGPFRYSAPVWVSINLLILALPFFAAVTFGLLDDKLVSNYPDREIGTGLVADWYGWHALNFIPFLEVTETLNLREPITDSGVWPGTLLLIFKGTVIVPIVLLFRFYRKRPTRRIQPVPAAFGRR
jgi:hypothetical protein